jgi:hypothetical protein
MTAEERALADRMRRLEGAVRRTRLVAGCALIGLAATWLMAAGRARQAQGSETVRTKALIVEDAQGRARIVLGAPMPDGRQQVGMKILNPDGAEQFGLGLKPDGSVSMGFDTRPGVGSPANPERLNMGVTASGRGWIRYLDNQTRARMWLMLDSTDAPVVQFLDWPDDKRILVRQLGFGGEKGQEWKR